MSPQSSVSTPYKALGEQTLLQMKLAAELHEAEVKAFDALARYKFQMFGYWAAIWVHLNRISGEKRKSPFKSLVHSARAKGQS